MSVYVWGFGKLGQLGNGKTDTCHTPVSPKLDKKIRCVYVHSGGYFTAVVTEDGRIYSFGCGKYGRLGTGDDSDRLEPVEVIIKDQTSQENCSKVKQVSCGIWHGAAITQDGNLYIWGHGNAVGDRASPSATPQNCHPPKLLSGLYSSKVVGVSCGNNFTVFWTDEGAAFSWGSGRNGVLGHGSTENKNKPTLISYFKDNNLRVKYVHAGFSHTGVICENGEVFMFGKNSDGALGIENMSKEMSTPKCIDSLKGIRMKELSCSVGDKHGHTLFLTGNGSVYSCGDGYKGKLGHGDQEARLVPTEIPAAHFNGEAITHVAAGGIHSAAVSDIGHVFTWGCGSDGRLGHPDGKGHRYLFRSDIPRIVDALKDKGKSIRLSTSYYHTVALIE